MMNKWNALCTFTGNGDLSIDNNKSERAHDVHPRIYLADVLIARGETDLDALLPRSLESVHGQIKN